MKIGVAKVGQERRVVIIKNNTTLSFTAEGLSCVLSDMRSFISAFDYLKFESLEEVKVEKFLPPLVPKKVFLPAVNFRSHSQESSTKPPEEPYFFTKFSTP